MKSFKLVALSLLMSIGGVAGISTHAQAGCNFHGCSQVPGVECNFHGCPNAPNGGECNFHGCPPATQPVVQPPTQVEKVYVPVPYGQTEQRNNRPQVNPDDIAKCINRLMFRDSNVGRIRTEISEQVAVQACTSIR